MQAQPNDPLALVAELREEINALKLRVSALERNAALAEQSLGTARELSQQMGELRTLMDGFATNVDRSARAGAPIRLSQASPVTPLRRAS